MNESIKSIPTKIKWLSLAMLTVSLGCNIAALTLPFMNLRKGISSEPYSLFHSVSMMWEKGLAVLAVLVVVFSIIFPFAKLSILAWIASGNTFDSARLTWLHRVEKLGKWSMLDVFLVSIVLSLASKQFLVGAKPELGLSCFIVAILLSMASGAILAKTSHQEADDSDAMGNSIQSKPYLLALSGLCLFAALAFPFLRIEDWFLVNREYSILSLVPALWKQGAWMSSLLTSLFLILLPLLAWGSQLALWFKRRDRAAASACSIWSTQLSRWSMLDVFGLALTLFAIESDHLMSTEIHWGALFLGATLLLQTVFLKAFESAPFQRSA